ncbi:isoleucine--tRNA ligase, cytoplasmic isoform X2 [Cimex lectularius]|nr:isoleucine--tRNA ligase, cytoplasmic isoform X2 [Cimex lectularius]
MRYSKEWEKIVNRIGRWIDFKNDYKTLYPSFMESVWWVFSELWNKGMVYRGVKVMPFSTACHTPLSNFESSQNYKDVIDPAIVPKFQLKKDPNCFLLAWTTTPWTLPSNLAICVHPEFIYVKLRETKSNMHVILLKARMPDFFKQVDKNTFTRQNEEYEIVDTFVGSKLKGEEYMPLFNYFAHLKQCFRVLTDTYVTEESGTGVVHMAPYFGEDDNRICLNNKLITRDQDPICPVDNSGRFVHPVKDFENMYIKDADKEIIKNLKERNLVFDLSTVTHSYPFCWRSETPLVYKAVPSWFIRVHDMSSALLKTNNDTYWVPEFVKEKRFANWLKEARDWAVSRNRYWGTPIPLWVSDDFEEIVCISSIKELEAATGKKFIDIHREYVDEVTIPSARPGKPPLRRVPEVFDCWFESGSMPYAQIHYPFENKAEFNKKFPADFIAEGIDQTRGWFYTLLVISTALFNKPPFKNLIVNGLVLASDGQKMSKSKKNFPNPEDVVNKFGADAIRLYLINSPVVRADKLKFKEEGVKDVLKDVCLPWYNAYRFFIQNVQRLEVEEKVKLTFQEDVFVPSNLMDKWILSYAQSLNVFVRKEMAAYRLYTVVPRLVKFIENLCNWYVRMNRRRLKGDTGLEDCKNALSTLGSVLTNMIRLMSPYTPFLTELMYKNLRHLTGRNEKSVHFILMPQPRSDLINTEIERAVSNMQTVIDLGRVSRDRKTIPIKNPLREVIVILNNKDTFNEMVPFTNYIEEELNVKKVTLSVDKEQYGVSFKADADFKTLGPRLKGDFKKVLEIIKHLSDAEIQGLKSKGSITIEGHTLTEDDLKIKLDFSGNNATELSQRYEVNLQDDVLVLLDVSMDKELQAEGTAREIINRVQKLRKQAHLVPTDVIKVYYSVNPEMCTLAETAKSYTSFIENGLKVPFIAGTPNEKENIIIKDTQQLKGVEKGFELTLTITGDMINNRNPDCGNVPFCRYANLLLVETEPGFGVSSSNSSLVLENPKGQNVLNLKQLKEQVKMLFALDNDVHLYTAQGELTEEKLSKINGETIVAATNKLTKPHTNLPASKTPILSKFVNVSCGSTQATILVKKETSEVDTRKRASHLLKCDTADVTIY